LPLNERGLLSNALSISIVAPCYYLSRSIPLRLMKYKDAITASISDKMTKAQLLAIANALQDQCLLNELDKPALIPLSSYIKDAQSRWDIHTTEACSLVKDIHKIGINTRKALVDAVNSMD